MFVLFSDYKPDAFFFTYPSINKRFVNMRLLISFN